MGYNEWLQRALGYTTSTTSKEEFRPIQKQEKVDVSSLRAEDMMRIMKPTQGVTIRWHRNHRTAPQPERTFDPRAKFPMYAQSTLNKMSTADLYAIVTDPNHKGDKTLANVRIEFISRVRRHLHKHVQVDKYTPLPKITIALAREYYEMCKREGINL